MAQPYLTGLRRIVERHAGAARETHDIVCRHFFSGAAAYGDGAIFMTLTPVGLALKLAEKACAELLAAGGSELRYFPKAPTKKGYVVLPPELADETPVLDRWILASLRHCRSGNGPAVA